MYYSQFQTFSCLYNVNFHCEKWFKVPTTCWWSCLPSSFFRQLSYWSYRILAAQSYLRILILISVYSLCYCPLELMYSFGGLGSLLAFWAWMEFIIKFWQSKLTEPNPFISTLITSFKLIVLLKANTLIALSFCICYFPKSFFHLFATDSDLWLDT